MISVANLFVVVVVVVAAAGEPFVKFRLRQINYRRSQTFHCTKG